MFAFFKRKSTESSPPEWLPVLQETEERWFDFLTKMEAKMDELCTEAIPALKEMVQSEDDQVFYRIQSGIRGQLENIRKRVNDTFDERISDTFDYYNNSVSVTSPHYDILRTFRTKCSDRYRNQFDKKLAHWYAEIKVASKRDFEKEYKKISDEYETIKDKFSCKQCSSPLIIEKIFFINTYITCPACQTQNTFEPSTQTKQLEHIGRSLAEQRTEHLREELSAVPQKKHELYLQRHRLKISLISEKDKKIIKEKEAQMASIEQQEAELENSSPHLYQTYLRAMFDEWNAINPAMTEEHEKFYQRLLTENKYI